MKILVLGAGGMAGHVISLYLREKGFEVFTLSANTQLDTETVLMNVLDKEHFVAFLSANQFDVVINCIALLVQGSESHQSDAIYLNSYLPHLLEDIYKQSDTRIIHISTDAVFSGVDSPYQEDSPYNGETFYGRSKALGEIVNTKDLTIRTSIIGPDLHATNKALFNWFWAQKGEIEGRSNAIWNGVTTLELAKTIAAAIDQNITAIYHLAPEKSITKLNLLQMLKATFNRADVTIKSVSSNPSNYTLVNTREDFDYRVPDYDTMLKEMKNWIINHSALYSHYEK